MYTAISCNIAIIIIITITITTYINDSYLIPYVIIIYLDYSNLICRPKVLRYSHKFLFVQCFAFSLKISSCGDEFAISKPFISKYWNFT